MQEFFWRVGEKVERDGSEAFMGKTGGVNVVDMTRYTEYPISRTLGLRVLPLKHGVMGK